MKFAWMLVVMLVPAWNLALAQSKAENDKDREIQQLQLRVIELKGKLLAKAAEVDRLTEENRKLRMLLPPDPNMQIKAATSMPASQPSTQPAMLTEYRFEWQRNVVVFMNEFRNAVLGGKNIDEELGNRLIAWQVTVLSVELEAQITVRFAEAEPYLRLKPPLDTAINLRFTEREKAANLKPGSVITVMGKMGSSVISGGGERFLLWPMECTIEDVIPPKVEAPKEEDKATKAAKKYPPKQE